MRARYLILLVMFLTVHSGWSQKRTFPMPNQNVQDAFSLATSIFSSYQGQKSYQNKINAIVTINTNISDPEQLVREYTNKMQELQREADRRKEQKFAELNKQIDLINKGVDEILKAADVDLGPLGNLAKDIAAAGAKQVARANANKKIEELKAAAEKELDAEMKKTMGAIYDKIVLENQEAQKEYLLAAAEVFSENEENHYIKYYNFYNCVLESMKKNYNHKSADWLKTGCSTPPKSYFGYSQSAPRFDYNRQNTPEDQALEPDFASFTPEAQIEAIDKKLQDALKKVDDILAKTEDAFQKVEYLTLKQQLVDKANLEKEAVKTGELLTPESVVEEQPQPQRKQYQPLLDCAIRKLALYKGEMPYPEFLEASRKYAEAELAENRRNPNAYIFLAELSDDIIEQYMLTGFAFYLDRRNSMVSGKFKAVKDKFGEALFIAIEKNEISFVNKAIEKKLLKGFEHQGITPFQYAVSKDNPEVMERLMPPNTDKYALIYFVIETGGPKVTQKLLNSVDVNSIPIYNGHDPLTASVLFNKKDIAFTLLKAGFSYENSLEIARSERLFEKTVSFLSFYAIDKSDRGMLDFIVQKDPNVLKPQGDAKENLVDAIVKDNKTTLLPILVKHGLNVKTTQYAYLLELAINSNAEEIGLALIELGIDVNYKPTEGGSLVNLIVTKKALNSLFDKLLMKGADISTKNSKNEYALMTALHHGDLVKSRKLLERNCAMDFWSSQSGNQLHWVVENGVVEESIPLLAQFKININGKDKNGDTPLFFALKTNAKSYTLALLKSGASVNVLNNNNITPLQFAIYKKSSLLGEMLGKCDNPNAQGVNGWTAMHFAAREGDVEAVKKLLEANANPLVTDNWGRTPYRVAREYGYDEIKKILRKKMGIPNLVKSAYVINKKTPKS